MGTVSSVSVHWPPEVIKEFQKEYPKVEFVIHMDQKWDCRLWIHKSGCIKRDTDR